MALAPAAAGSELSTGAAGERPDGMKHAPTAWSNHYVAQPATTETLWGSPRMIRQ